MQQRLYYVKCLDGNGVQTAQVKFSTLPGKNCVNEKPILVNKAHHKGTLESYKHEQYARENKAFLNVCFYEAIVSNVFFIHPDDRAQPTYNLL